MNNFTTYVGVYKRWIEIRAIHIPDIPVDGIWDGLSCKFIIYSNDKRNKIGELQPEHNQDNSMLGTFFYFFEDNIAEFKGKETLGEGELLDITYEIKSMMIFHYGASL